MTEPSQDGPPAAVQIKAQRIKLTPQRAHDLLSHNTHNRGVSRQRVSQYTADIRAGNWRFNGEAIKIAHTGQILDGQHRLIAVIDADRSIDTLLITGLPPEAQETMDQGRARTLGDVLKLRGERNYLNLAAATRLVALYERDGIPFLDAYRPAPTVHECLRTLDRNPDLRASVKLADELSRGALVPVSAAGGLHYLFAIADPADAEDFIRKLLRGDNLHATSPVFVLRARLLADLRDRQLRPKERLALVVKAWNAYRRGDTITRIGWNPGGAHPEKFPAIDGLANKHPDTTEAAA
jgi:hypothetical protein